MCVEDHGCEQGVVWYHTTSTITSRLGRHQKSAHIHYPTLCLLMLEGCKLSRRRKSRLDVWMKGANPEKRTILQNSSPARGIPSLVYALRYRDEHSLGSTLPSDIQGDAISTLSRLLINELYSRFRLSTMLSLFAPLLLQAMLNFSL